MINRGGLKKCSNDFYVYLQVVEQKTHNILEEKSQETNMGNNPTEVSQIILADQSVQEKWEALVKLEDKTQRLDMEIQGRILKLYIT